MAEKFNRTLTYFEKLKMQITLQNQEYTIHSKIIEYQFLKYIEFYNGIIKNYKKNFLIYLFFRINLLKRFNPIL